MWSMARKSTIAVLVLLYGTQMRIKKKEEKKCKPEVN